MEIIESLWAVLLQNETSTLIIFLFATIMYLLWEKKNQNEIISTLYEKYDASIKEIISKYHEGQIDLVKALDEIKIVLSSMQRKI